MSRRTWKVRASMLSRISGRVEELMNCKELEVALGNTQKIEGKIGEIGMKDNKIITKT